jgi:hypothetical protein
MWLWHSNPEPAQLGLARVFAAFLRRFEIEHTFRFFKQTLGWTRSRVRTRQQADRWTWIILAAYTQLRLARSLTEDLRRLWEKPLTPTKLTPARVRRGFPRIRRTSTDPAAVPKTTRPGQGRPRDQPTSTAPNATRSGNRPKWTQSKPVPTRQRVKIKSQQAS